jgi:hypothetical protein
MMNVIPGGVKTMSYDYHPPASTISKRNESLLWLEEQDDEARRSVDIEDES